MSAFLVGASICTAAYAQDRSIVQSFKTDTAPVIDGEIDGDEWDAAGPWIVVTENSPNAQSATNLIEEDAWGGDEDLSFRFKTMWVENTPNFYILYEVTDDIAMEENPERPWERDQIESFFDGTNLDGDEDPDSYQWWDNEETYGKFGVSRFGEYEGNGARMATTDSEWDDGLGDFAAFAAASEAEDSANYTIELAVSILPMIDDFDFAPYEGSPTEEAEAIVQDSTTIKFTAFAADDDNFDTGDTERSNIVGYYRELDGEDIDWRRSDTFATLTFVDEWDGTIVEPPTCVVPDGGIAGDLDGDGTVAFGDFLLLSANFGATDVPYASGDIDCDGTVAFADFLVLSANFGQSAAAAASVPEPSSSVMLLCGLFAFAVRRRRS